MSSFWFIQFFMSLQQFEVVSRKKLKTKFISKQISERFVPRVQNEFWISNILIGRQTKKKRFTHKNRTVEKGRYIKECFKDLNWTLVKVVSIANFPSPKNDHDSKTKDSDFTFKSKQNYLTKKQLLLKKHKNYRVYSLWLFTTEITDFLCVTFNRFQREQQWGNFYISINCQFYFCCIKYRS